MKEREKQDWRAGDGAMTFVLIVSRCYRRQLWQCEAAARIIGLHIGGASSVSNKTLTLTRTRRNMQGAYHPGGPTLNFSRVCSTTAGRTGPARQADGQANTAWVAPTKHDQVRQLAKLLVALQAIDWLASA